MAGRIPSTFRKWVVQRLSTKFREAVELVTTDVPTPGPTELLVRNRFVGINASDINFTAARYDPTVKPPFDCGFEAVGEVVAAGESSGYKVGQSLAYIQYGAFAEYVIIPAQTAIPIPAVKAEFLPLIVSGLTAAISLDKLGEIKKGETVLVTAAAGGTGQFAVQWAKNAGCHVIGTCSTDDKVEFLKSIGCDRPINYSKEDLGEVLKKEYPKGVNVVYESVGGEVFETCVSNIAVRGRIILIGFISGYDSETGYVRTKSPPLPPRLLKQSASVRGFFLNHFFKFTPEYMQKLAGSLKSGEIKSTVDPGLYAAKGHFKGIEAVPDAVEYLYTRKNIGKIVVEIPPADSASL